MANAITTNTPASIAINQVFAPTKGQLKAFGIAQALQSHGELASGLTSKDSNVRNATGKILSLANLQGMLDQASKTGELRPLSRYLNAQLGFDKESKFFISEKKSDIFSASATLKLWVVDTKAEKTREIRAALLERSDFVAVFEVIATLRTTPALTTEHAPAISAEPAPAPAPAIAADMAKGKGKAKA